MHRQQPQQRTTELSHGITRRNLFKMTLALGGAAAATAAMPAQAQADEPAPGAKPNAGYPTAPVTFCVMSDIHYFDQSLWSDCEDYTTAENSDRKMFRESRGILKKALADVVAAKPNFVLVPGDITKDGERACHEGVHELFAQAKADLAKAGVDTTFLVINGNHDLNNHHGLDFSSGSAQPAKRTDPLAYKELWEDCGYTDTVIYDKGGSGNGSLSYVARPCKGLTVIAVDTCKYNEPGDETGPAQVTSGYVGPELLAWVCSQAKQATADGDMVVAFQHHGVVPHFGDEPTLMGEYLVDDFDNVARAYAEAGISCVFTGHMHANDIAGATYGERTIYDIETGSLVTYPSYMRTGSIEFKQSGAQVEANISVDVHDLGTVAFEGCGLDGQTQAITAYGKDRTLTVASVQTMLSGMFVEPVLEDVAATGTKAALAGLLGGMGIGDGTAGALNAALWGAITGSGLLPTSREEGIRFSISSPLSMSMSIYFDAELGRIRVDKAPEDGAEAAIVIPSTPELEAQLSKLAEQAHAADAAAPAAAAKTCYTYIDASSFSAFLDNLLATIDTNLLGEPEHVTLLSVVAEAVRLLLEAPVDDAHSVLGLVDFAYQSHLLGCEKPETWADTAIDAIGSQGLLGKVAGGAVNSLLLSEPLKALASAVTLDLKMLLMKGDILGIGNLVPGVVAGMFPNLGALLEMIVGDGTTDPMVNVGELVAGLLPASLTEFARSALYTLSHDENEVNDHAFSTKAGMTDPDYRPGGSDGSGNGNGNGNEGNSGNNGGSNSGSGSGNNSGNSGNGTPGEKPGSNSNNGSTARPQKPTGALPQTGDDLLSRIAFPVLSGIALVAAGIKSAINEPEDVPLDLN